MQLAVLMKVDLELARIVDFQGRQQLTLLSSRLEKP